MLKLLWLSALLSTAAAFVVDGGINFIFFGTSYTDVQNTTLNSDFAALRGSRFYNDSRPTFLYAHGWRSGIFLDSTRQVVEAFLARGDHNVVAIEWSKYAVVNCYSEVVASLKYQAAFVVLVLRQMQASGVDLTRFYFAGHSLGAQLLGRVGHQFWNVHGMRLTRITGLDPAGPQFANRDYEIFWSLDYPALNKENAQFVDIIHTDASLQGISVATGHVDFWPNGGKAQPGCSFFTCIFIGQDDCTMCNHQRVLKYFAESVRTTSPQTFWSIRCADGVSDFNATSCTAAERASMGFHASPLSVGGNYFVETNSRPPYGK